MNVTICPSMQPTGKAELYQLAPEKNSLMMSYVIKTGGGRIVVIDGGIAGQGAEAPPYLPAAIRAILGIKEGEYFEVDAWFLTHHHGDHFYELAKMLRDYKESDNYRIRNFYFAFPRIGVEWTSSSGEKDHDSEYAKVLYAAFDHYYGTVHFEGIEGSDIPESAFKKPENAENYYYGLINGCVINDANISAPGGLSLNVDGVGFEILQKWDPSCLNVNSTSTVIKMVCGSRSVLFTGDSYEDNARELLNKYASVPEVLDCEYVQMGHHGQNGPDKSFYDGINAENRIRLWPIPVWVWNVDSKGPYNTFKTRQWVGLPEDYRDFGVSERDIVTALYTAFPEDPSKTGSWTKEVLEAQRAAVFN